jgi:hypothetical protein
MRSGLATVLALLVAGTAGAQEPPPTGDSVATVGGEPIPAADFEHWFRIAAHGDSHDVEPPPHARCIAAERRAGRRDPRGRCERRYRRVRRETLSFLIQGLWVRQEAAALGVRVTPERVRRAVERQKRESFPTERAYRRFLRLTGMTETDIRYRVELDLLQQRLARAAVARARPVTATEVSRFYRRHRRAYRGKRRDRALESIRVKLTVRRTQHALERFIVDFRSRFRSVTVCGAGYEAPECARTAG